MSDWGAGRDPGEPVEPRARRVRREPSEPAPVGGPEDGAPSGVDPVGVAAVVVGLLGIVVFGILAALVAGILGAIAGGRARESGRSYDLAYLAFLLAAVDGVVWLVLHFLFDIPIQVG